MHSPWDAPLLGKVCLSPEQQLAAPSEVWLMAKTRREASTGCLVQLISAGSAPSVGSVQRCNDSMRCCDDWHIWHSNMALDELNLMGSDVLTKSTFYAWQRKPSKLVFLFGFNVSMNIKKRAMTWHDVTYIANVFACPPIFCHRFIVFKVTLGWNRSQLASTTLDWSPVKHSPYKNSHSHRVGNEPPLPDRKSVSFQVDALLMKLPHIMAFSHTLRPKH